MARRLKQEAPSIQLSNFSVKEITAKHCLTVKSGQQWRTEAGRPRPRG